MKRSRKRLAAVLVMGLALRGAVMVYGDPGAEGKDSGQAEMGAATESEWEEKATASQYGIRLMAGTDTENLWDGWTGDFSFLSGDRGDGSETSPYEIRTAAQLKALSRLAAMGMALEEGETAGDYRGCFFSLEADLDLDGLDWIPIGYGEEAGDSGGFEGTFLGNGHKISGFRLKREFPFCGLFGLVQNGRIEDLRVEPSGTVAGADRAGLLAGKAEDSVIYNCRTAGEIQGGKAVGGIVGEAENAIVEDCLASAVLNSEEGDSAVGGIAGLAGDSVIVDGEVSTGDNHTSRIRGKGIVGGIAGVQKNSRIYNVRVTGTVGGAGTQTAGGITGRFAGGYLKVARFEGTMGNSGLGGQGRRGTFIGSREEGDYFRYGDQVAYLFADGEEKIAANVCGSQIPDDNRYGWEDHIGYFHRGDLFFTLVQESRDRDVTDRYFYQELEEGILQIMDRDNDGALPWELGYTINHFAASEVGRPVRGYLVTIPRIDAAGLTGWEDVAVLEARPSGAYGVKIDQLHRGAVAAGRTVTVYTSPKHTDTAKFQLEGPPVFLKGGKNVEMSRGLAGEYVFTMPPEDTEISAVYTKVAASVRTEPAVCPISVVQERTGDRRDPVKTTRIFDPSGKLIATYINGELEQGTKVQPVYISAVVDENNDVSDPSVKWSVDDPDLIRLQRSGEEDDLGYTGKSAAIEVNLDAGFFRDILARAEEAQAQTGYREPISDVVYGYGGQGGGVAVLTASTRPSASYEGKVRMANCDIRVTFQILDRTETAVERVSLDQESLEFTVTRKITGSRSRPKETVTVTSPQILTAEFSPGYYSRKEVVWTAGEDSPVEVRAENDSSALVTAVADRKWIRDIMEADDAARAAGSAERLKGAGEKAGTVTVTAEDRLGNRQTAVCAVKVRFVTDDRTGTGSGGSGGSGGSSGSSGGSSGGSGGPSGSSASGAGNTSPGPGNTSVPGPDSVSGENGQAGTGTVPAVEGTWILKEDGRWMFESGGKILRDEWAYIVNPYAGDGRADWFSFNSQGYMRTGWYQEPDGSWFYLSPVSDGSMGRMVTGWNWIDGACYYFHPVSDGSMGRLWVSEVTPDGYQVDSLGRWVSSGRIMTGTEGAV